MAVQVGGAVGVVGVTELVGIGPLVEAVKQATRTAIKRDTDMQTVLDKFSWTGPHSTPIVTNVNINQMTAF